MKKIILLQVVIICCSWLLTACNAAAPEKYFDLAVLNCNMMVGFAGEGLSMELDQPSLKMVNGDKDHPVPMKRKEVIDNKIQFFELNLGKLKQLKETDDTKDMLQASVALYDYVLPVCKTEYQQLAKLYDEGAAKEEIHSYAQAIHDKYDTGFDELFNKLTTTGKSYAAKHNIKVNWGVQSSPHP